MYSVHKQCVQDLLAGGDFVISYLNPYKYSKDSRYMRIRTIKRDTVEKSYHEVTNLSPLVSANECQLYKVAGIYANRLDLIADMFYGDASLWWFIAKQNGITDFDVVPNDTILQIPPYNSLMTDGRALEPLSYIFLNLGRE